MELADQEAEASIATLILNTGVPDGHQIPYCGWCDNSGWLYLHTYVKRKAQNGSEYREQLMAGCGFCQLGHEHHRRYGGPWGYKMEDIDATIAADVLCSMSVDAQKAYEVVRAAGEAIRQRTIDDMQPFKPRIPKLDKETLAEPRTWTEAESHAHAFALEEDVDPEFAHLDPGPGPDTMTGQSQTARPHHQTPDTRS